MLPGKGEMSPHAADGTPLIDKSVTLGQTWAAMEQLLDTGKVKAIGVSNMIKSEVEEILKTAKHKPDAIQLEVRAACAPARCRDAIFRRADPRSFWYLAAPAPPLPAADRVHQVAPGPGNRGDGLLAVRQPQPSSVPPPSPSFPCRARSRAAPSTFAEFVVKDEGKIIDHPVVLELAESAFALQLHSPFPRAPSR